MKEKRVKEKDIVRKIKTMLERDFGGFWFKSHGGSFQRVGLPDLIGSVDGKFVAMEVKKPSRVDRVSFNQEICLMEIKKMGQAIVGIVTNPEDASELLLSNGIVFKKNRSSDLYTE